MARRLTPKILRDQFNLIARCYKLVHFDELVITYLIVYFIVSMIVWALDPDIHDLSDALWFTFQTGTTIGYGDLIVNNPIARFITVLFSIYSMALVAVFTGIIAGYFMEVVKSGAKDSAAKFLTDLERLPEMSHEELVDLSNRVKRFLNERNE